MPRPSIPRNSRLNKRSIHAKPMQMLLPPRPSSQPVRDQDVRVCPHVPQRDLGEGEDTAAGLTCGETAAGFNWRVTRACPTKMPEDDRSTMQDFKQLPALPGHRLLCQCGTYQKIFACGGGTYARTYL